MIGIQITTKIYEKFFKNENMTPCQSNFIEKTIFDEKLITIMLYLDTENC